MKEIEAWNGPFLRNDLRICFIWGHHSCVDPSTPTLSRSRVRIHLRLHSLGLVFESILNTTKICFYRFIDLVHSSMICIKKFRIL